MTQQQLIFEMLARLELTREASFHDYLVDELSRHEEARDILILSTYVTPSSKICFSDFGTMGTRFRYFLSMMCRLLQKK